MAISLKAPVIKTRVTIKDDENTLYVDFYGCDAHELADVTAKLWNSGITELAESGDEVEFKARAKRGEKDATPDVADDDDDDDK